MHWGRVQQCHIAASQLRVARVAAEPLGYCRCGIDLGWVERP